MWYSSLRRQFHLHGVANLLDFFLLVLHLKQSTLVLMSIDNIQSLINSIRELTHLPLFNAFIWKAKGDFTSQSQMYLKCIILADTTSWWSVPGLVEIDTFWHIAIHSTSWTLLNSCRDRSHYSAHFRRQHGPLHIAIHFAHSDHLHRRYFSF